MKIYFAPMEGVTGYIYRNAFETFYGKGRIDKYFMPFISPNKSTGFRQKEINDVLPAHNTGLTVIPQILTNQSKDFFRTVTFLMEQGYQEVNLNFGCPSGTVVSKNKGAGFLSVPDELDAFLDEVFTQKPDSLKVSIKTRIGKESPDEFGEILKIYNQYPLEELIIHPRIQTDYYKNLPNMEVYAQALQESTNPVCYNGNLFRAKTCQEFALQYPATDAVMLGRGLIGDPGLIEVVSQLTEQLAGITGKPETCEIQTAQMLRAEGDRTEELMLLKQFHDRLLHDYLEIMPGDKNAIYKMKEIWFYMKHTFADSDKFSKRIKKAQRLSDYEAAVNDLFHNCSLKEIVVTNF